MFKLGGANPPQIQFLTSFVCGQHIKIDTYFVLCAKQHPTCRDIFNIKYSPKSRKNVLLTLRDIYVLLL